MPENLKMATTLGSKSKWKRGAVIYNYNFISVFSQTVKNEFRFPVYTDLIPIQTCMMKNYLHVGKSGKELSICYCFVNDLKHLNDVKNDQKFTRHQIPSYGKWVSSFCEKLRKSLECYYNGNDTQ